MSLRKHCQGKGCWRNVPVGKNGKLTYICKYCIVRQPRGDAKRGATYRSVWKKGKWRELPKEETEKIRRLVRAAVRGKAWAYLSDDIEQWCIIAVSRQAKHFKESMIVDFLRHEFGRKGGPRHEIARRMFQVWDEEKRLALHNWSSDDLAQE